jgi:hypothetical protein
MFLIDTTLPALYKGATTSIIARANNEVENDLEILYCRR